MGVLGKANIGGVLRNLTGDGYVNIGGVLRPISIGNYNVGGVLLSGGYTWKKYNVTYSEVKTKVTEHKIEYTTKIYIYKSKTLDEGSGKFGLSGGAVAYTDPKQLGNSLNDGYCYVSETGGNITTGNATVYQITLFISYKSYSPYCIIFDGYKYTSKQETTYVEKVTSSDKNAYPDNGLHTDGYWYVKQ